jgi:hypothetical protein
MVAHAPSGGYDSLKVLPQQIGSSCNSEQFEQDFARHLRDKTTVYRVCGSMVVGVVGALSVLGLPIAAISAVKLSVASAVGVIGGFRWCKRSNKQAAQTHGLSVATVEEGTFSASNPYMPSLLRLSYIVAWSHEKMTKDELLAPGRRHQALLREAICAFLPWAQRLGDETQAIEHLSPLYQFLHWQHVADGVCEFARCVACSTDRSIRSGVDVDTGRTILAIVFVTIVAFERLEEERCSAEQDAPLFLFDAQSRQSVKELAREISTVFSPSELREALATATQRSLGEAEQSNDASAIVGALDDASTMAPFLQRCKRLPCGDGQHKWFVPSPSTFRIRSSTYLSNRKKMPAGPYMFDAVSCDVVRLGPEGPIRQVATHPDFGVVDLRRRGDTRFVLVFNWILPPYQCIMTCCVDPTASWFVSGSACPQGRVWRRFIDESPTERNKRIKIIFSIDEGPWALKKLAGFKKPILIGSKILTRTYHVPDDYVEVVFDVSNGEKGGGYEEMVTGLVLKKTASMKMSFAGLLEGTQEDELPESLLFGTSFSQVDFSKCRRPMVGQWTQIDRR